MAAKERGLSSRQWRFVVEYLRDGHATNAAIRAGYSPIGAQSMASQLLIIPKVASAIEKEQAIFRERTLVTREKVVRELSKVAFAEIEDHVEYSHGQAIIKDGRKKGATRRGVVQEVTVETGKVCRTRIKLYDKSKAIEQLTKLLGLDRAAPDKSEAEIRDELEALLKSVAGRVASPAAVNGTNGHNGHTNGHSHAVVESKAIPWPPDPPCEPSGA